MAEKNTKRMEEIQQSLINSSYRMNCTMMKTLCLWQQCSQTQYGSL